MDASTTRSYAGQPVTDRRSERRRQFLAAGLAVFGETGYASSSITLLCKTAGLARSQFYEHFTNREDLLMAVYDMINAEARDAVEAATGAIPSAEVAARAEAAVAAYAESIGGDPRRAAVSYVEIVGVSPRVEERRLYQRELWYEFMAGELRKALGPEFEPVGGIRAATTGFVGALMALVHQWSISEPRPALTDLTSVLTRFLIGLMQP
ncbi:TetR/AcrR family transcriptional regulator [Nocardia sp. NPDC051030]|uniref:TetR/AcrR family transcriptional regulator n=1 Tax=Nocardia sp. NPDC051030 TaxID=3155162 RepID=UPI003441C5F2